MVNVFNRWTRKRIGQELEQCGQVCTICEVELAVVAVVSNTDPPREEIMPNPCSGPPVNDIDHSRETLGPIDIHNFSFEVDQALPF